jgi:hypothetical protein
MQSHIANANDQVRSRKPSRIASFSSSGMSRQCGQHLHVLTRFRGIVVAKVIEYLSYKVQYADFATGDITEDFTERIPPEIALEL